MGSNTSSPIFSIELDGCTIPVFSGTSSPCEAANRVVSGAFDALARAHTTMTLIDPVLVGAQWDKTGESSSPLVAEPIAELTAENVRQE